MAQARRKRAGVVLQSALGAFTGFLADLGDLTAEQEAIAAVGVALAAALDSGGLTSPAPVARELRDVIAALTPEADDDGDAWVRDLNVVSS